MNYSREWVVASAVDRWFLILSFGPNVDSSQLVRAPRAAVTFSSPESGYWRFGVLHSCCASDKARGLNHEAAQHQCDQTSGHSVHRDSKFFAFIALPCRALIDACHSLR